MSGLLTQHSGNEPRRLASAVIAAQAAGVPAIISEANSVSCGGVAQVSDSPASAVWAVRFVLSALKTGFREVRFHFAGDPYDPFVVEGEQVVTRPLDDALIALNQWLPVGATLRSVNVGVRGLVATSVTGPTGQTTLILDNEGAERQKLVLRSAAGVHVETLSAAQTGTHVSQLGPRHGRVKLTVAPNSIFALSSVG